MASLRTHHVLWVVAGTLGMYLLGYFLLGHEAITSVLNILLLGVSIIVSWSWGPAAWDSYKRGVITAADKIIMAIWGSWSALAVYRLYTLLLDALGHPIWLVNTPIDGLGGTFILLMGVFAAYATVSESDVPRLERNHVLLATFIGGAFVGAAIAVGIVVGF